MHAERFAVRRAITLRLLQCSNLTSVHLFNEAFAQFVLLCASVPFATERGSSNALWPCSVPSRHRPCLWQHSEQ